MLSNCKPEKHKITPFIFLFILICTSCKPDREKIKPVIAPVSEAVYASGIIKSKEQYEAFATVNGIIKEVFVLEGDRIKKGQPLLTISNDTQTLNKENAELTARYSDFNTNRDKLAEAYQLIEQARSKMKNDSALYARQKNLWQEQVGTKMELEQRELAYQNSRTALYSARVKYNDLKRQLSFLSEQSKNNLRISATQQSDFTVKSEIDGTVYNIFKSRGEMVGLQTPLAVIGDSRHFILEMQIDEYDIFSIRNGQLVLVTLDSYKGIVFKAVVTKIYPIMNERSKTFKVEAEFIDRPETLYPNVTFEANIVLRTKNKALLIPRNYLIDDSKVLKSNGDTVLVKTGLKDYKQVEVLSGISTSDELIKPE